nr:MAG TPA: hypothetical protein [Caudoviricetes sp.]DAU18514.1 MAG TPA: hypothetical protein [Caudoviricetes sp.]
MNHEFSFSGCSKRIFMTVSQSSGWILRKAINLSSFT